MRKLLKLIYHYLEYIFLLVVILCIGAYLYFIPSLKSKEYTFSLSDDIPTSSDVYINDKVRDSIDFTDQLKTIDGVGTYDITLNYYCFKYDITIHVVDNMSPIISVNSRVIESLKDIETNLTIHDDSNTTVTTEVTPLYETYMSNGYQLVSVNYLVVDEYDNSASIDTTLLIGNSEYLYQDLNVQQNSLEEMIQEYVLMHNLSLDDLSYGYVNLETNETVLFDEETLRTGASTYKLPLNMIMCDLVNEGILQQDSLLLYHLNDYEIGGGDLEAYYSVGELIPLDVLQYQSLYYSNNTASRIMFAALGGFEEFKSIANSYSDAIYDTGDDSNVISVNYLLDCLEVLVNNPDKYSVVYQYLSQAELNHYGRYTTNIPMLHKYGYYNTSINDCGYVFGPIPFIFVVLSEDYSEIDIGNIVNLMVSYTLNNNS